MTKIDVPYMSQKGKYPTGCESVSTVMLLRFLGFDISVDKFIQNYLDCRDFETRDGCLFGPDPKKYFCGSPYNEDDFGCYAPVICRALKKFFSEARTSSADGGIQEGGRIQEGGGIRENVVKPVWKPVDETGTPIDTLLKRYIDKGMPVIFWACIDMREPVVGPEWKLLDTGETFTWISNEHCMLLVGYDDEGYYFNDPYEGHGCVRYPKQLVKARHQAQYEMAVGVEKYFC